MKMRIIIIVGVISIKIKMLTRVTNILESYFNKIQIQKTVTAFWNCNLGVREMM